MHFPTILLTLFITTATTQLCSDAPANCQHGKPDWRPVRSFLPVPSNLSSKQREVADKIGRYSVVITTVVMESHVPVEETTSVAREGGLPGIQVTISINIVCARLLLEVGPLGLRLTGAMVDELVRVDIFGLWHWSRCYVPFNISRRVAHWPASLGGRQKVVWKAPCSCPSVSVSSSNGRVGQFIPLSATGSDVVGGGGAVCCRRSPESW